MKKKLLIASFFAILISASVNGQWIQQTSYVASAALNSIHCVDNNTCMCVGNSTTVRKTVNGGTIWTVVNGTTFTNKLCVKMYDKDTILIGQSNGTFRRTTNGGTNWSLDLFGGNSNFAIYDISYPAIGKNVSAVGGSAGNPSVGGHITTNSTDAGKTWPTFINVSGEPTMFGLHCFNTTTFVACAGAETVFRSTDGGTTWAVKHSGPVGTSLYDMNFPTSTIGYAVGGSSTTLTASSGAVVYRSNDAGATWVNPGNSGLLPNTLYGVHFVNKDTGYVVGNGGKIQITKNGGTSWSAQLAPVTTDLNKVYFTNDTIGYVVGANGVILKTGNGGLLAPFIANAGNDRSICIGNCTTLGGSPTASGGTAPYAYSWSPGSNTTSSVVICPSAATVYTLTITDGTSATAVDIISIGIYPSTAVSFTGLSAQYCENASSIPLTGNPTGGIFSGPGISGTLFYSDSAGSGTHTITYAYTDPNGCITAASQSVTVLPLPVPAPLCLVSVDSITPFNNNIIVWEKPVVTYIDSFKVYRRIASVMTPIVLLPYSATSKFVDNTNGVNASIQGYDYALSIIDTCGIESALSNTHSSIYLSPPLTSLPARFALTWTDYSGFTFTDYEIWRDGNGSGTFSKIGTVAYGSAKQFTDNAPPSSGARYRIRATAPGNCSTGVEVFKYTLSNTSKDYTAVSEISLNNWLNVYPNPNHGTFRVELSGLGYEISGMKIYNMLGEVIYQSSEKNKVSQINIPEITPGVYHLEIITDKGTANKKITIQ